jgi:hypothetical protein
VDNDTNDTDSLLPSLEPFDDDLSVESEEENEVPDHYDEQD